MHYGNPKIQKRETEDGGQREEKRRNLQARKEEEYRRGKEVHIDIKTHWSQLSEGK